MRRRGILLCIMLMLILGSTAFTSLAVENEYIQADESAGYGNTTKVKLEWDITNAVVTYHPDYKWDADNLKWVETSGYYEASSGSAEFKFTNYGTQKIKAKASFTVAEDMESVINGDVSFSNNDCTVDTPVTADKTDYEESEFTDLAQTVTAKVDLIANAFENFKDKKDSTLGVYTLSISEVEEEKETCKVTIVNSSGSYNLTYNETTYKPGESIVIDVTQGSEIDISDDGKTLTVDGKSVSMETGLVTWSVKDGDIVNTDCNITVSASCILSGTSVMLGDGTTKAIENITREDSLMTFNFYTGELDENKPMYVLKHEDSLSNVIKVTLDDGSILEMCDHQQFFDMSSKKYFDIDSVNYIDAIGKNIMYISDGEVISARITGVSVKLKKCTSYEIFTEYNKNFVAGGVLTVEPGTCLDGIYEIGEDLKINQEQYEKDVSEYGRYQYSDFEEIMSEDEFDKYNIADKKIAVGKGTLSEETLYSIYAQWIPIYRQSYE